MPSPRRAPTSCCSISPRASGPKAPTTSASCGSRRRRTASRSTRPRPGPLSPRPTAHHGNISHYVLICVSSNTFTSLFLYSRRKDGRGALFEEFKGALTEQYACQELIASCGLVPYYWSAENSRGEVDFLVQSAGTVYAIEVKAEENLRAKSLRSFKEKYPEVQARRFSLSDYREQDWLTNVPLYLMGNTGLWL
ncbi:DUF4143 domain-containing protein [Adlercreutzia equolifaciens]|uniref:DUF4143 domain-containing protein n=1 Tax=Adlercreutzia equolifaciens TaxID=446660 RepID=UPI0035212B87